MHAARGLIKAPKVLVIIRLICKYAGLRIHVPFKANLQWLRASIDRKSVV